MRSLERVRLEVRRLRSERDVARERARELEAEVSVLRRQLAAAAVRARSACPVPAAV